VHDRIVFGEITFGATSWFISEHFFNQLPKQHLKHFKPALVNKSVTNCMNAWWIERWQCGNPRLSNTQIWVFEKS